MRVEHNGKYTQASAEVTEHGSIDTSKLKPIHLAIFFVLLVAVLVYHFRDKIGEFHDRLRTRRRMRYVNLTNGFNDDLENGLSSDNFDITSSNHDDTREGLLEAAKEEIKQIMHEENIGFDQARLKYTKSQFGKNNIDANGMPLDPRTVTFK